jgi:multiple sugar transport system ATP-binding protein
VLPLPRSVVAAAGDLREVVFGVRPESLELVSEGGFELVVELVEELGADAYLHGKVGDDRFVVRVDGRTPPRMGDNVRVGLRGEGETHAFDPETTLRLS